MTSEQDQQVYQELASILGNIPGDAAVHARWFESELQSARQQQQDPSMLSEYTDITSVPMNQQTQATKDTASAPLHTNKKGGVQSHLTQSFHLLPVDAVTAVAEVLFHGAKKYGQNNWRLIPVIDHLNHALYHVFLYIAGNRSENHLSHAACRLLMALEQDIHRVIGDD
jgi:hypothetical protein